MSRTSTELARYALNGPTMGTRWSARFLAPAGFDTAPLRAALQGAVDPVDAQMSLWRPDSDLLRLNAAAPGVGVAVPEALLEVLALALDVGRASGGAFDIGVGDAVSAWGFGPAAADPERIRTALRATRRPAHEVLELDRGAARVRKTAPVALDLNGIAKGYGVDRLAAALRTGGIAAGLVGIDGEMRASGLRPGGTPWAVAVETPDPARRTPHSVVALQDAAVATSGDYRHRVRVSGHYLSHTMDPRRGAPLAASPASVTVVARSCAEADAWATALMVLGAEAGAAMARRRGLEALFLLRGPDGAVRAEGVGGLFGGGDGPLVAIAGDSGWTRGPAVAAGQPPG